MNSQLTAQPLSDGVLVEERITTAEAVDAFGLWENVCTAEAEKLALIEELSKPIRHSDEAAVGWILSIVARAMESGLNSVKLYRFPRLLCTDYGRCIDQQEPVWGANLVGVPRRIHDLWDRYFRSRGYRLTAEIVSPGCFSGEVVLTLTWD